MSVWGLEAEIAVLLAMLSLLVAIGPLTYLHYRRHGRMAGWSAVVGLGAFFYFWGVVSFTLFPLPTTNTEFCTLRQDISYWQLVPLASIVDLIDSAALDGVVATVASTAFWQVAFNVLLLIPLGFLLAYRFRKGISLAVAAGLGVSLLIELTQGTGVWGLHGCPYRLADVDDLLANTAGAVIGWVIGRALIGVLPDPDPPPVPDVDPPRVPRRLLATLVDYITLVVVGAVVQIPVIAVFGSGRDVADSGAFEQVLYLIGVVATSVVLFVAFPLLRSDRATPGQVSTWLACVKADTTQPAGGREISIRWLVRWAPLALGLWIEPPIAIAAVAMLEIVTTIVRADHRSMSATAAETRTVTRRSLPDRTITVAE